MWLHDMMIITVLRNLENKKYWTGSDADYLDCKWPDITCMYAWVFGITSLKPMQVVQHGATGCASLAPGPSKVAPKNAEEIRSKHVGIRHKGNRSSATGKDARWTSSPVRPSRSVVSTVERLGCGTHHSREEVLELVTVGGGGQGLDDANGRRSAQRRGHQLTSSVREET